MNNTNSWKDNQGIAPVPGHDEALSDVLRDMRSDPHPSRRFVHVLADRIEAALARQETDKMDIVAHRILYLDHSGEWVMLGRPWVDGRPDPELLTELVEPNSRWRIEYAYAAPPVAQAVDLEKLRRWAELCDKGHGSDVVAGEIRRAVGQQAGKGVDRE